MLYAPNKFDVNRSRHFRRRDFFRLLSFETLDVRVMLAANSFYWDVGAGDWNVGTNWDSNAVPTTNDDVFFNENNSAPYLSPPAPQPPNPANWVYARNYHVDTSSSSLNMKGVHLAISNMSVYAQGPMGMGIAPGPASLTVTNSTSDLSQVTVINNLDVGVSGQTQAINPQNKASLTVYKFGLREVRPLVAA